jgi:hypothetical protein
VGHAAAEQFRANALPTTGADSGAASEDQALSVDHDPAANHVRNQTGDHPWPAAGLHTKHIVWRTAGAQRLCTDAAIEAGKRFLGVCSKRKRQGDGKQACNN